MSENRFIKKSVALVLTVFVLSAVIAAQEKAPEKPQTPSPAAKAVATGNGAEAKLLRQWYKEGTAAGNVGDFYDNRDGGHSRLATRYYPQLSVIKVTDEERELAKRRKTRPHWGLLLNRLYPHVTFGNSSTSGGPPSGCSNPRYCILSTQATGIHYMQYVRSHLYMYPEHRDHDPGHNGHGGWGDLYHANTPYMIISQGSSGSDQVFMKAVAYTLAAFRPEVKKALVSRGLLMPTVQYIFRRCNRNVKSDADYLTGAAHPSVFDGKNVDALAMVKMAHAMDLDSVPPMIQLKVLAEDEAIAGRDYFEIADREKLFDTPAAIARVGRSVKRTRQMFLSTKASFDLKGRPLKFKWVVLRGDPARVKIKPASDDGSEVELLISHHERMPVPGNPALMTNRVDVGAFATNGKSISAPGFVSYYFLDDEARTYADDGRILEVVYGYGDTRIGHYDYAPRNYPITDWKALIAVLTDVRGGLPSSMLRKQFSSAQCKAFAGIAKEYTAALTPTVEQQKGIDEVEAKLVKANDAVAKAEAVKSEAAKLNTATSTDAAKGALNRATAELKTAQRDAGKLKRKADKQRGATKKAAEEVLKRTRKEFGGVSAIVKIEDALNAIKDDVDFALTHAAMLDALAKAQGDAAKKKAFAAARDEWASQFKDRKNLSRGERNRVEQLNIAIPQSVVYPDILRWRFRRNFAEWRLATQKSWRDVYHYDAKGKCTGWTRHRPTGTEPFTPDGRLVIKKDASGRVLVAQSVRYVSKRERRKPMILRQETVDELFDYTYASDEDRTGKAVKREKVPAPKKDEKAGEAD